MADFTEDELEETRAALAPTLDAITAILPWLTKPCALRFDVDLNQRWITAGQHLTKAWSGRFDARAEPIRPAIFALYTVALETADIDCLRLGEALASAADQLEAETPSPRLIAALTASIECLSEKDGLEHPAFSERANHFAQRLEMAIAQGTQASPRSAVIDRLFVAEAGEQLERMQDALALLPPDIYAFKLAAVELAQAAENIELFGVLHLARALAESMNMRAVDLDNESSRSKTQERLRQLSETIAAVDR